MTKRLLIVLFFSIAFTAFGHHIKGGFFTYQYLGPGINNPTYLRYKITLTVYVDTLASTSTNIDAQAPFTFFEGGNQIDNVEVPLTNLYPLHNKPPYPCYQGNQNVGYQIVTYVLDSYELPVSALGYTVSWQRCCRKDQMDNLINSGAVGETLTIDIPGTSSPVPNANQNSSPIFPINDTILVCQKSYFEYPVAAVDPDNDSLSYYFCNAYNGGSQGSPIVDPSAPPPFSVVPYNFPFSGPQPMGSGVTINPKTGLISGIAPNIINNGQYVITICVTEWRNGVAFALSRKELHIQVDDCSQNKPVLNPNYITCDGFTLTFTDNGNVKPNYEWIFSDPSSGSLDTAYTNPATHVFTDSGVYLVRLRTDTLSACVGNASTVAKVFPGFFPGFIAPDGCTNHPITFTDTSRSRYGVILTDSLRWNFGDGGSIRGVSNPTHSYAAPGVYRVSLYVVSSKGCSGTVSDSVHVYDRPPLQTVPALDTLICNIDQLQLNAQTPVAGGTFFWTPNYNINNQNIPNPIVSPQVDTTYNVLFQSGIGCSNTASVKVHVVTHVTLQPFNDTTICRGDSIKLNPITNALHFIWSPVTYLSDPNIENPIATPPVPSIRYTVNAIIGGCSKQQSINISTVPYPNAQAGSDTTVCFGTFAQLHATGGNEYSWSPTFFLSNPNIADPIANPDRTIQYIVRVTDILGCPKPTYDTVVVNVSRINAAVIPTDTAVVIGEPLQLLAFGGTNYFWWPATGLNSTAISNPVALITGDIQYFVRVSDDAGCADTATVRVRLYNTAPDLFVPNAFTPGSGINNIFRPIAIGIKRLNYFQVFNRWGQLVFSTTQINAGWDGTFKGKPQDAAAYVWIVQAVDYKDRVITKKGSMVLIR